MWVYCICCLQCNRLKISLALNATCNVNDDNTWNIKNYFLWWLCDYNLWTTYMFLEWEQEIFYWLSTISLCVCDAYNSLLFGSSSGIVWLKPLSRLFASKDLQMVYSYQTVHHINNSPSALSAWKRSHVKREKKTFCTCLTCSLWFCRMLTFMYLYLLWICVSVWV